MIRLLLLFLMAINISGNGWLVNIDDAKAQAKKEHKYILLNFSGSDWCGPCVRMHKEIFDSEVFKVFANDKLVLVNADFPRLKKNQLPKEQQKLNDAMADKYNADGKFPYTALLNEDGKVIKDWDGYPKEGMNEFLNELKQAVDGSY